MSFPRAVVCQRLGRIGAKRRLARPGNDVSGGLLILAGEPATGVTAMQDLGPLVARVLLCCTP
jgi:hypothetical protein